MPRPLLTEVDFANMSKVGLQKTCAGCVPAAGGEDDVPPVVFVQESTLLCRWDTGTGASSSNLEFDWEEDMGACGVKTLPPSAPTRVRSPPTSARQKCRDGSLHSGVNVENVGLTPVNFSPTGGVTMAKTKPLCNLLELQQTTDNAHNKVTAVFCIRRAGCGSCRDHGLRLSSLAKQHQIQLFGIVKETGVDDAALHEFYKEYFNFPIYKDEKCDTFRFLGDRKISPWQLLKIQPKLLKRYKDKNIKNIPFGGDIFTQGGVLLFDKSGQLRYVYYEKYGDELDVEALSAAIQECQQKTRRRRPQS